MRALAVALLTVATLAACGGGPGANQPPGSIKVSLTEFSFTPSSLTAPSGRVVFFLVNTGSQSHDLVITNQSGTRVAASELISAGDTNVFTVDSIAAGSYIILCDQPGHEASGMKGSLTVS
jgi:plastocyanin